MFNLISRRLLPVTAKHCARFSSSSLTVHGHYISQPARSVLWLLKINNQPFNFVNVPAMAGGTKKPEFKAKFPIAQIPALEDGDFCMSEGSAIMQYLCDKHGWDQWWPQGSDEVSRKKRAKISEYLSYHHHGTRMLSHKVAFHLFAKQFFKKEHEQSTEELRDTSFKIIANFEKKCLGGGPFIAGCAAPSIADLMAYAEVYQLVQMRLIQHEELSPALQAWARALQAVAAHDDVHTSVLKLGAAMHTEKE